MFCRVMKEDLKYSLGGKLIFFVSVTPYCFFLPGDTGPQGPQGPQGDQGVYIGHNWNVGDSTMVLNHC